jgi:anti-sigma B factor antagonist
MRRGLGDFAMEFYYHEIDRTVLILGADGGLNSDTSKTFVQQLESLVEAGVTRIIVDCTHLEYISSYGIGLLVRLHNKLAKHGGDVKIAAPGGFVMKALSVMHMAKIFEIYPDVDQARLAFRPKDAEKS